MKATPQSTSSILMWDGWLDFSLLSASSACFPLWPLERSFECEITTSYHQHTQNTFNWFSFLQLPTDDDHKVQVNVPKWNCNCIPHQQLSHTQRSQASQVSLTNIYKFKGNWRLWPGFNVLFVRKGPLLQCYKSSLLAPYHLFITFFVSEIGVCSHSLSKKFASSSSFLLFSSLIWNPKFNSSWPLNFFETHSNSAR